MNRDIKFRAWDKKLKKWNISVEIDCFGNIQEYKFNGKAYYPKFFTPEEDTLEEGTERFDLVQFTGLFDKNGKEIYEGDIIEYSSEYKVRIEDNIPVFSPSNRVSEVVFHEGCFCEIYHAQNNSYFGELPSKPKRIFFEIFKEYSDSYEVIGNIYENPELLNNE